MTESNSVVDAFRQRQFAALATVVSVEGSSYRRPGARMLITESGETTGVLSGGCLERDVCERAQKVMRSRAPVVVRYDTTNKDDVVWGLGLGCNGIIDILIEPAGTERVAGVMQLLAECAERDAPGAIATVFRVEALPQKSGIPLDTVSTTCGSGWVRSCAATELLSTGVKAAHPPATAGGTDRVQQRIGTFEAKPHVDGYVETTIGARALLYPDGTIDGDVPALIFDDLREATCSCVRRYEVAGGHIEVFIEVVQPRVRLVVFGAGPDVLPIVDLAKYLGWHTTVVDTSARVSSRERFSDADAVLLCRPEDVMSQVSLSERTSVVVMTHNYLHDVELVGQLLPLPLRYLGCLGPRQRTERLLNEVSGDMDRLHAPVGLDIGAETAEEIALSIVSEIKAVLSQRSGAQLRERAGSIHGWSDVTPVAFSREGWESAPSF